MKKLVSLAVLAFFVALPLGQDAEQSQLLEEQQLLQMFHMVMMVPPATVEICHLVPPNSFGIGTGILINVPEDSPAARRHRDHGDCEEGDPSFSRDDDGLHCSCGLLSSSKRFKEDIHDMGEATTNLMRLRPVTFHYKKEYDSGDGRLQYGLIAEEVAEVYPELVVYDDQGRAKAVLYQQLSGMLLNEFQKQHKQVQELKERLSRLEQVLTAQQSLAALTK